MAVPNTERDGSDSGYTMVELATVMLVIGALLMIAVLTFLNAQDGSQRKVAQSRAKAALMANRSFLSDRGTLPAAPEELKAVEPSLEYTDDNPATPGLDGTGASVLGRVYVRTLSSEVWLASASRNGETCYWVKDSIEDGTWYAEMPCGTEPDPDPAVGDFKRSW